MIRTITNRNFWIMIIVDVILAGLAYFLAYYLRFDGDIPAVAFANWMKTVVWIVPLKLACFFFFGIYKGMWRYTGIYDLENLIKACVISSGIVVFILVLKVRFVGFPRSVFAIDLVLTFLFLSGVRVGIRLFMTPGHGSFKRRDSSPQRHRGHGEKTKKLCDLCVSVVKIVWNRGQLRKCVTLVQGLVGIWIEKNNY